MKIAIIGAGNMGSAIALGIAQGTIIQASEIICSDHSEEALNKVRQSCPSIRTTSNNSDAVKKADFIVLAIKPWLLGAICQEIKSVLDYKKQSIISIVAGVSFDELNQLLKKDESIPPALFRLIPNTAIAVQQSMTIVAAQNASNEQTELILKIFNELGNTLLVEERLMGAGTALGSCGIAFAFRYIRAAMEGGVEMGFYPDQAKAIVLQTLKGAVELLESNGTHPESEIDKVTTPGGITIKGLNEMEHAGFTSSIIKGLKSCR